MDIGMKIVNDQSKEEKSYEFRFVRIPAGFGCEEFLMLEAPVTRREWGLVMGREVELGQEEFPMTEVNWEDCENFCKKLSEKLGRKVRMPTEVEWCRAVGMEPEKLEEFAVFDAKKLTEVRTKRPNEFGLYDMRGLVWEWLDEESGGDNRKILRGGSWFVDRSFARAVFRFSNRPAGRYSVIGFRVLLEI